MRRSLYFKLTLAFMLVAFTTAGLVALFIRLTSADRLSQLILDQQRSSLQAALSSYYSTYGSWKDVETNWLQIQARTLPTPSAGLVDGAPPPGNIQPGGDQGRRNFLGLADAQGIVLVSVDHSYPVGAQLPANVIKDGTAVIVGGKQVGTILAANQSPGFTSQESQFLQRTNQALFLAIGVALVVALVIGILLARTLTHPLQALIQAAEKMTHGQVVQQVKVTSDDEIGKLAAAFNRMSQEVARVNQLRRQMTADIAHDLRTPLTVIAGYIESMQDGVLQPTPQRFALIYTEIQHLQNLVGDLRMLSLADSGELALNVQKVSPRLLIERSANVYCNQADQNHVSINVEAAEGLPEILVDEVRMGQVFGNLISNALRYTPQGGKITLSAQLVNEKVEISVKDTGTGIDAEELPFIFDRFHRADKSRHSETGESGLGLAIVKALVESQGGTAWADSSLGIGTTIHLMFPASPE